MNIDEFIEHAREVAEKQKEIARLIEDNEYIPESVDKESIICGNIRCAKEHEQLAKWLERLKEYQQLEEQGRIVCLPCKVGDRLYWICDEDEDENEGICVRRYGEDEKVTSILMDKDGKFSVIIGESTNPPDKIGSRWALLTREEAEAQVRAARRGEA